MTALAIWRIKMTSTISLFCFVCSCFLQPSEQQNLLYVPRLPERNQMVIADPHVAKIWTIVELVNFYWVNIVNVYSKKSTTYTVAVSNDHMLYYSSPGNAVMSPCIFIAKMPSGIQQYRCSNGSFDLHKYIVVSYPGSNSIDINVDAIGYNTLLWNTIHQCNGSGSMNRSWADYKAGFFTDDYCYWIGNDALAYLTTAYKTCSMEIDMWTTATNIGNTLPYVHPQLGAYYSTFKMGNETTGYNITATEFSPNSNVKDWMPYHNGMKFTTYDRDNDLNPSGNCAVQDGGGWWFNNCSKININNKIGTTDGYNYGGPTGNFFKESRLILGCFNN